MLIKICITLFLLIAVDIVFCRVNDRIRRRKSYDIENSDIFDGARIVAFILTVVCFMIAVAVWWTS